MITSMAGLHGKHSRQGDRIRFEHISSLYVYQIIALCV